MIDRRNLARKSLLHDYSNNSEKNFYYPQKPSKQLNGNTPKIGTLLIALVVFAVLIKYVPEWREHINREKASNLYNDICEEVITRTRLSSSWIQNNYGLFSHPFLCGVLVTLFIGTMVYLDSDKPGVNPPSPFSPTKQERYLHFKEKTCHLNYLVSIASGFVVFCLLFLLREDS